MLDILFNKDKHNNKVTLQYDGIAASWLFCLTFIQIPKPVDWEKHILQGSEDWRRQKVVSELFEERQIWVKESLAERLRDGGLKLGESRIKR